MEKNQRRSHHNYNHYDDDYDSAEERFSRRGEEEHYNRQIPTVNDNHNYNHYDDNDSSEDERFSRRGEVEQNNDGMSTDGNAIGEEVMTHQQTNHAGAAVVKTKRNNRGRDPAVNNSNYTKTMGGYMDKISQLGIYEAVLKTKRQELSFAPVEGSPQAPNRRRRQYTALDNEQVQQKKSVEECVVCWSAKKTHAFVPCGHQCVCDKCAKTIQRGNSKCPLCQAVSERIIKIYQ
jgi:hypothetical protein